MSRDWLPRNLNRRLIFYQKPTTLYPVSVASWDVVRMCACTDRHSDHLYTQVPASLVDNVIVEVPASLAGACAGR